AADRRGGRGARVSGAATPAIAVSPAPAIPSSGARSMRRLLVYASRHRGLITRSVLVLLVVAGLELALPDLGRPTIDGPGASGDAKGLVLFGSLLAGVVVLGALARGLQQYVTVKAGQRVGFSLRQDVFGHLQSMGLSYFDRHPVGTLVTRVTSDI